MSDDLRAWGYAPGNYSCICRTGGDPHRFDGDKRAVRCEMHARQQRDAAQQTAEPSDLAARLRSGEDGLEYAAADEIDLLRAALIGLLPSALHYGGLRDCDLAAINMARAVLGGGGHE